jgi:hypothetical protein
VKPESPLSFLFRSYRGENSASRDIEADPVRASIRPWHGAWYLICERAGKGAIILGPEPFKSRFATSTGSPFSLLLTFVWSMSARWKKLVSVAAEARFWRFGIGGWSRLPRKCRLRPEIELPSADLRSAGERLGSERTKAAPHLAHPVPRFQTKGESLIPSPAASPPTAPPWRNLNDGREEFVPFTVSRPGRKAGMNRVRNLQRLY